MSRPPRSFATWLVIAAVVIFLDQATKHAVLGRLSPGESIRVLPFFDIVLAFNTGAAFSFLAGAGGWQRGFFIAIGVLATAAIVYWLRRHRDETLFCSGLALILGGAIGNLYDRVMLGKVVDFLLVHDWLPTLPRLLAWLDPFPAFNIADSAITIGAVIVILDSFIGRRDSAPTHSTSRV